MERFEHGGNLRAHPGVTDFSANLNPLGMPEAAVRALRERVEEFAAYPDPDCVELTEAIARYERVPQGWVLACAGATDAFARLCLATRPARALLCAPCYSGYEQALEQVGAQVAWHDLRREDGFVVTDAFARAIDETVDLVFVANPNNPTGLNVSRDVMGRCLERARAAGAVVVLDECFADLCATGGSNDLLADNPHLVIVKALTKTFCLAGLRAGYALCANPRLLAGLRAAGQPWAVSAPAQVAGVACLAIPSHVSRGRELVAAERGRMVAALASLGLSVVPGKANYLLFEGPAGLCDALLCRGLLVRHCANYRGLGERWYRIAVRTPEENARLVEGLGEVVPWLQGRS